MEMKTHIIIVFFFGRDFWTSTIVVAYVYMYGNATVFFKIPCKCNVKLDQTLLFKSLGTVGYL